MLRSHTTAMIPPALRALAVAPVADVLLVRPGMVYRRDAIDRQHTGTPHQLDLWRVTRRPLTGAELEDMITTVLAAVLPGAVGRLSPRVHPYTRDGYRWTWPATTSGSRSARVVSPIRAGSAWRFPGAEERSGQDRVTQP